MAKVYSMLFQKLLEILALIQSQNSFIARYTSNSSSIFWINFWSLPIKFFSLWLSFYILWPQNLVTRSFKKHLFKRKTWRKKNKVLFIEWKLDILKISTYKKCKWYNVYLESETGSIGLIWYVKQSMISAKWIRPEDVVAATKCPSWEETNSTNVWSDS